MSALTVFLKSPRHTTAMSRDGSEFGPAPLNPLKPNAIFEKGPEFRAWGSGR